MPALGFSLFMIAVGAILTFAVQTSVRGIDIGTVGVIFMIVGAIGMVLSLLFWTSFAPFAPRRVHEDDSSHEPHVHM